MRADDFGPGGDALHHVQCPIERSVMAETYDVSAQAAGGVYHLHINGPGIKRELYACTPDMSEIFRVSKQTVAAAVGIPVSALDAEFVVSFF